MKPEDVRMARAALHWSLEQLAQASGIHRNTISNFETSKYAGDPATVAAIKHTLESFGVIFPDEAGENSTVMLRRFQVGDVVRFRAQSRVRGNYDMAEDELGTVVWVEPHPPETGPTYKIEVHFERARVPRIFKFEYELVKAAPSGHVPPENVPAVTPHVSKDDIDAFCSFCVSLRSTFRHYQILFEEGADLRRELLQAIAPTFFPDLNEMLNEHLILQICKITDPEGNPARRNLTVEFLINNSDFPAASKELDRLNRLGESIHAFRTKILPARNKLIGHLDRRSVLDDKALGGADKDSWNQFWLDLQDFVHILHKKYIDPHGVFYLNGVGQLSDADSLVKALKESSYFRALLKDEKLTQKCADVAFGSKFAEA
jgi:transcriptional regulator with XRE-family HTH domain